MHTYRGACAHLLKLLINKKNPAFAGALSVPRSRTARRVCFAHTGGKPANVICCYLSERMPPRHVRLCVRLQECQTLPPLSRAFAGFRCRSFPAFRYVWWYFAAAFAVSSFPPSASPAVGACLRLVSGRDVWFGAHLHPCRLNSSSRVRSCVGVFLLFHVRRAVLYRKRRQNYCFFFV